VLLPSLLFWMPLQQVGYSLTNLTESHCTYLVSLGGATVWPYAGISVFPEKGAAVFWHNVRPSDIPDSFTKHAACPG